VKLSEIATGRDNNFNLIRIIAAYAVLFTHSFAIAIGSGDDEPRLFGHSLGSLAIHIFFITSGFLVTASLIKRKSFIEFVWARFLRIFPALLIMLLLSTFVMGAFFTSEPLTEYFTASTTYYYLAKCLTLFSGVAYDLPGVFTDNPYQNAVNGSLWTLPHEVRLYILLAVVWLLLKKAPSKFDTLFIKFIIAVYLTSGIYLIAKTIIGLKPSYTILLLFMFFSGSLFYILKDKIIISRNLVLTMGAILIFSVYEEQIFKIVYLISLPYLLFYLAYVPSGFIRKYNSLGDYSYGIYIYAFPVQQSIAFLIPNISVIQMITYSTLVTLLLAILSWHMIERRALLLKDQYVAYTRSLHSKIPFI